MSPIENQLIMNIAAQDNLLEEYSPSDFSLFIILSLTYRTTQIIVSFFYFAFTLHLEMTLHTVAVELRECLYTLTHISKTHMPFSYTNKDIHGKEDNKQNV